LSPTIAPEGLVAERVVTEDAPAFFNHSVRVLIDGRVERPGGGTFSRRLSLRWCLDHGHRRSDSKHERSGHQQDSDHAGHLNILPSRVASLPS
jgi:hypothetical protein